MSGILDEQYQEQIFKMFKTTFAATKLFLT